MEYEYKIRTFVADTDIPSGVDRVRICPSWDQPLFVLHHPLTHVEQDRGTLKALTSCSLLAVIQSANYGSQVNRRPPRINGTLLPYIDAIPNSVIHSF